VGSNPFPVTGLLGLALAFVIGFSNPSFTALSGGANFDGSSMK